MRTAVLSVLLMFTVFAGARVPGVELEAQGAAASTLHEYNLQFDAQQGTHPLADVDRLNRNITEVTGTANIANASGSSFDKLSLVVEGEGALFATDELEISVAGCSTPWTETLICETERREELAWTSAQGTHILTSSFAETTSSTDHLLVSLRYVNSEVPAGVTHIHYEVHGTNG